MFFIYLYNPDVNVSFFLEIQDYVDYDILSSASRITKRLSGLHISTRSSQPDLPQLDEEQQTWRNKPLRELVYLYLDTRYMKVQQAGSAANLMASEVKRDCRKPILCISLYLGEAKINW